MTDELKGAVGKLLKESGLSGRRFARLVLAVRGERSWRRWKADGVPAELEEWAEKDVVRLERRGHMLHLTIFAPLDPKLDRRAADGEG